MSYQADGRPFAWLANKNPGYAGGIKEVQLQAKTAYAIINLSPSRYKKA